MVLKPETLSLFKLGYVYWTMGLLTNLLSHPLTRGLDIDAIQTTELRKQIICNKPFLKKIYAQWYFQIIENLPASVGPVLELGTGAGFLKN